MELKRRCFLKMGLAAGAAAALDLKLLRYAGEAVAGQPTEEESVIRSTCSPNCTGACGFNVHVSDGRITTLIQSADSGSRLQPQGMSAGAFHDEPCLR